MNEQREKKSFGRSKLPERSVDFLFPNYFIRKSCLEELNRGERYGVFDAEFD